MPLDDSPVNDEPHPYFERPLSHSRLWRYLDLPKYLAMLSSSSLWLARADQLGDPFEGSMSSANVRLRGEVYEDKIPVSALEQLAAYRAQELLHTYVSCWHENEYESAGMWRLYMSGHGIAVQTNYDRIRRALEYQSEIFVGRVRYVDYDTYWIPEDNMMAPFLHKRLSFQHEREVRAIVNDFNRKPGRPSDEVGTGLDPNSPPVGVSVAADLDLLIEQVRVSPEAPSWFADVVSDASRRYGHLFPVAQSELTVDPVY